MLNSNILNMYLYLILAILLHYKMKTEELKHVNYSMDWGNMPYITVLFDRLFISVPSLFCLCPLYSECILFN